MDTNTIKQTIQDLKQMGVFWLGFTGGEPLLNRDIVEIIESVGEECILKLFTTGEGLNRQLAKDMANAGLFYVSVSLDHHDEQKHDEIRQCKGAFRTALRAIDNLKKVGSVHVSVSTVLSKNMIVREEVEKFIEFLIELDVHEVWLSEMKPSQPLFWEEKYVINEIERKSLIQLQDEFNKRKKITVNFLGHFESKNHFGCNAGHKMVYVDPFGDVSPCVFTPISFGNVNQVSVKDIFTKMTRYFSPSDQCWINHNFELFKNYPMPIDEKNAIALMRDSVSGKPAKFFQLLN